MGQANVLQGAEPAAIWRCVVGVFEPAVAVGAGADYLGPARPHLMRIEGPAAVNFGRSAGASCLVVHEALDGRTAQAMMCISIGQRHSEMVVHPSVCAALWLLGLLAGCAALLGIGLGIPCAAKLLA